MRSLNIPGIEAWKLGFNLLRLRRRSPSGLFCLRQLLDHRDFCLASDKNPDQGALNYILQIFVYIRVQNKMITCSWEILGHLRDLGWEAIMQTLSIERHLTDTWHWLQHAPEIDYILFYIFYMIYRFFYIIQHLIQTLSAISLIPGLLNIGCILHY